MVETFKRLGVETTIIEAGDRVLSKFDEEIVDSMDLVRYYPEHNPVKVKLIGSKESKKIIGAQIIGQNGFAKRIDVLALAIQNRIRVEDLADTDMAYAPPFAPVWDPFLIAAGILKDKL